MSSITSVLLILTVLPAHAGQIAPNPNPADSTITVSGSDANNRAFYNNGTINVTNKGTLANSVHSLINNNGAVIANGGTLKLYRNFTFNGTDSGTVNLFNNKPGRHCMFSKFFKQQEDISFISGISNFRPLTGLLDSNNKYAIRLPSVLLSRLCRAENHGL